MARLAGKKAFLTAAGQGIGKATALAFAAEGAQVVASDISPDLLEALKAQSPGIETRSLDVLDSQAVQAAAEEIGAVDVLFNCAGYVHQGTVLDCGEDTWAMSISRTSRSIRRGRRAP